MKKGWAMEVEIPLPDRSLAPEGGGEPMDLDMILDRVIQNAQNEAMNEFLAGTSRCDEVVGDVEAWPVLALLPSHEERGILLAGGCDKPSPFAGHTAHARERHHV